MDELLWGLLSCDLDGKLDAAPEIREDWIERDYDKFVEFIHLDVSDDECIDALTNLLNDYQLYGFKRGLNLGIRLMTSLMKE